MTRQLPNGSYYYAVLSVLVAGYVLLAKSAAADAASEEDAARKGEAVPLLPLPAQDTQADGIANFPAQAQAPAAEEVVVGLSVAGFLNKPLQLSAMLPRPAPPPGAGGSPSDAYDGAALLTYETFGGKHFSLLSSNFAIAQVFALPLLTLAVHLFAANYDTDTNFQVLFLAVCVYSLLDVVVHRLGQILGVYDQLMRPASGDTSNRAGDRAVSVNSIVNLGKFIDVLAIVLQTMLGLLAFFCMRWHLSVGAREKTPILGGDHVAAHLNVTAPALYITYFVLCVCIKVSVLFDVLPPLETPRHKAITMFEAFVSRVAAQAGNILFALLNFFTVSLVLVMTVNMYAGVYTTPFPASSEADITAVVDTLVHRYHGGWALV